MAKYPATKKTFTAALSIFTGPRIEQLFSIMNHVVNKKTNRLDVETFSAIQTVKYDFMNTGESAIQRYHRANKLKSPVDGSVCYHMRTAYGRHKRKKQPSEAPVPKKKQKLTTQRTQMFTDWSNRLNVGSSSSTNRL
ncbi:hypothetical protein HOLleu_06778 [Holothuria leucospilota]|uniref:Uncharacterized protein n=1 Tax=Holothuria leucospilota TaxID=206669 RepID=A0A9Q1HJ71_HOLLE|nr:hypothetical protein HOLleu_06778 [Holothuria leucospilota]